MAALVVRDTDRGYAELVKRIYGIAKPRIEVGILAGAGADEPALAEDGDSDSALTLLQVAIFNEFGTTDEHGEEHVPERSFVRGWFDESEPELRLALAASLRAVVAGKRTKEQALELLALDCVAQIQLRISAGIDPENAASTVQRKGSSTPLVNLGQLRAGVSSRVTER